MLEDYIIYLKQPENEKLVIKAWNSFSVNCLWGFHQIYFSKIYSGDKKYYTVNAYDNNIVYFSGLNDKKSPLCFEHLAEWLNQNKRYCDFHLISPEDLNN